MNTNNYYNEINLQKFIENELSGKSSIHGMRHFENVEAFGILLATKEPDADKEVIRWFAYLHDCCRENDWDDLEHGPRAAWYIGCIRHSYLSELNTKQVEMLRLACRHHTDTTKMDNPTIDCCFDADRLDLPRVGIELDASRMATRYGQELALKEYQDNLILAKKYVGVSR